MKRHIIIYMAFSAFLTIACENKRDSNGDLGGMWQMTEWRDRQSNVVATKEDRIFLAFRNQLARFMKMPKGSANFFLSEFKIDGDSIRFFHIVNYPTDTIAGNHELLPYGIGSNASMKIEHLTSDKLILSNGETGTIIYRKY
ncbi:lipocalin-like domain-containing protein [bacterium]|nr:lipocalin-like domain-containing protein [bacterium]